MSFEPFLEKARQAGLLSDAELRSWTDTIKSSGISSPDKAAAKLVESNVLTRYQADCLLTGNVEDCVLAGRYHLLEKIGAGGMGTVFRAKDAKLNRTVAVKIMSPHHLSQTDAVTRFRREAQALAQLDSPYIVQAFDVGEDAGRQFLVMEYVHGISLTQLVRDKGRIAPTIAADYIYQAALGMQQAHNRGLIHRDLKPGNLLLTKDGQVKVLDLGLARFVQDLLPEGELTRENVALGTPDYMSPEQFASAHNVDRRADIYSLGCTLYFLIAGRVPFPGSSLAEKAQAHQQREAQPLEEICPEISAGLAMVASMMMAKRPTDRPQDMSEVAEALAPYVAGSSPSIPSIKQTISWQGSRSTLVRRRRRPWARLAAGGLAAAALVVLALLLPQWLGQPETTPPPGNQSGKGDAKESPPKPEPIPNVLTVAKDGTGQYPTIGEALAAVKPGQTIRVLDGGIYEESVRLDDSGRYAGVTLEAVQKATITRPPSADIALLVQSVPNVTVRGFRLELGKGEKPFLSGIFRRCPGVVFDGLELTSSRRVNTCAISVETVETSKDEPPVTVRNCTIRGFDHGIRVEGLVLDKPERCRGVTIHQNKVFGCQTGIWTSGWINDVHIVANRVWGCGVSDIELKDLTEGSSGILVANNTLQDSRHCLVIREPSRNVQGVEVRNNLILAKEGPDIVFLGKDQLALKPWRLDHNWRQVQAPPPGDPEFKRWVRSPDDTMKDQIELLSLEPQNSNYLRPAKDSPLTTSGAGGDLPSYVGAVPPEGAEPWNWKWTWDAYFHKTLTVSQDAKDEAQFKSINAALEKVQPGMTIRVLDKAEYREAVYLNRPRLQSGTTIETSNRATLVPTDPNGFFVKDVPNVTVQGFRLRAETPNCFLATATGQSPGTRFVDLEMTGKPGVPFIGVSFEYLSAAAGDVPALLRNCRIESASLAIRLRGTGDDGKTPLPCGRILIQDNLITGGQFGLIGNGSLHNVVAAGNQFIGCSGSAIQLVGLLKGTKNLLFANNTMLDCNRSFTLFDKSVEGEQVRISNTLVLSSAGPDMVFVDGLPGAPDPSGPHDGNLVHNTWKLDHNWREAQKPTGDTVYDKSWIPPSAEDVLRDKIEGLSRTAGSPDYLRPPKDSALAKEGAGKTDPTLPVYIGAVPPEGVEAWDWNRTWKAWASKK